MPSYDLILLHAPSILDFRNRDDLLFALSPGPPISVSPIYEIYPLGLRAIETHLREQGKQVGILNLASMMLADPSLDVDALLGKLDSKVFGIDLHWLVHTQGALELARRLKALHPQSKVLFGGISATHFHRELIAYPQVDFVLRGVDTPPAVSSLLERLDSADFDDLPNLSWKDAHGAPHHGETRLVSDCTSAVDWSEADEGITYFMALSGAGCEYNCRFCAGSRDSMRKHTQIANGFAPKRRALFMKELESIKQRSTKRSTLVALHHWFEDPVALESAMALLDQSNVRKMHLTIFDLLPERHLRLLAESSVQPFFELSIQSADPAVRALCGCPSYSNAEVEAWLELVFQRLPHAVVAVFFMIGLPEQNRQSVLDDVRYAESLLERFAERNLNVFTSVMRPYLDVGSQFHDDPDRYGYTIFHRTLQDYERAMVVPHWRDSLNYETRWLSRTELVDVSYEAIRELYLAKQRRGNLPSGLATIQIQRIDDTVALLGRIGERRGDELTPALRAEILSYNAEVLGNQGSQQSPVNLRFHRFWHDA